MRGELFALVCTAAGSVTAGLGLRLIVSDALRLPSYRASVCMKKTVRRAAKPEGAGKIDAFCDKLAHRLAGVIKLSAGRKEDLASDLAAADIQSTPEELVASSIVKAAIPALLALPVIFIFPLFAPVILALVPGIFYDSVTRPRRIIAARREAVEFELPMFVARIEVTLRRTRDILTILNSYRKNAGPELKKELDVTVADIQSGGARTALSRLEARVGSPSMTEIVRGLSAVLDGNDPPGYWTSLQRRLSDARRQQLLRFAGKIPGKIAALSFGLLACVFLIYAVVIGGEVLRSIGVLFG